MDLSVIIVNYNSGDYLYHCLNSVKTASYNIDCEIFVVDNNSDDGSAEIIKTEFPDVRLIINKDNRGFSAANNQAIKLSEGRFLLLLNPDTLVMKDTFTACMGFMDEHADAGALGVRMINGEGIFLRESKRAFPTPLTAFYKIFGLSYLFSESPLLNKYYLPQIMNRLPSRTEVISGAFMFIRREALNRSGLLDEDFFMYGEDIDLSYRLTKTGYRNYYLPYIQIVHYKGKCTSRNSYKDILQFYKAMRIYTRKRAREGKYKSIVPFILLAVCFRELLALLSRFLKLTFRRQPV